MTFRLLIVVLCLGLDEAAQAAPLRASAEAPLSSERLADALRSYVEGAEVTVEAAGDEELAPQPDTGEVRVLLRKSHGAGEDAEVIVASRDETVAARLPGALRSEDLYRAAALKAQALLQRRLPPELAAGPVDTLAVSPPPANEPSLRRLVVDVGLTWMQPSEGRARQGLRLGAGLGLAPRWRLGLGAYFEPPQSSAPQGVAVSSWELPVELALGLGLHQGAWQSWLQIIGQAALRRLSADAAGVVSTTETTLSPRAGAGFVFALAVARGLFVDARLSLLAAVQDTRYRVDGQVVGPAARTLVLAELGLLYGVR